MTTATNRQMVSVRITNLSPYHGNHFDEWIVRLNLTRNGAHLKFSFRSMMTAVAVCAVALAWGLDHFRLQKAIHQLNAENAQLMERITPPSGFVFPAGVATNTVLLNSEPEDRHEVLRILDQSITHGEKK